MTKKWPFMVIVMLFSWPISAQITFSGDIQVIEISTLEYDKAYKKRLKQPKIHQRGTRLCKLNTAYCQEFRDSLTYYGLDSLCVLGGYQKLRLKIDKSPLYQLTVNYPIQSYSYIYNRRYERKSNAMWGGGVFDGCWYAAEKSFDCDEYVHLRIYNLNQSANLCAEIKEASLDYFIPCFDDKESYFFDKSHDFFFTIMKKWEGPCKYYKVTIQK